MKKFLALVLALVMTMSLVTISAGAEDFTDNSDITYEEAVDVMTAIGVVGGYTDGSFNPEAGLTRGAAAKIICNMILGPTTAEALVADTAPYSDVAADNVFAGYIAYCAQEGIISGYSDGTFRPAAPLTGYAFMKMLLGTLGYDATKEGYVGSNWSISVAKQALALGLDDGLVADFAGAKALTREEACLYALNTLTATMVKYENDSTITVGDIVIQNNSKAEAVKDTAGNEVTFMDTYFAKLSVDGTAADDFDAPANTWTWKNETVGTYTKAAKATYTEEVTFGDLYAVLGSNVVKKLHNLEVFVDGNRWGNSDNTLSFNAANITKGSETALTTGAGAPTGNGVETSVYVTERADGTYDVDVVCVNTYVGKITKVTAETAKKDRFVTLSSTVGTQVSGTMTNWEFTTEDFAKDDYVTYTVAHSTATGEFTVKSMALAEKVDAVEVTAYKNTAAGSNFTADGVTYEYNEIVSLNGIALENEVDVYLDANGYVVLTELYNSAADYSDYLVITNDALASGLGTTVIASAITLDGKILDEITLGKLGANKINAISTDVTPGVVKVARDTIYSFSVTSEGKYNLKAVAAPYGAVALDGQDSNVTGFLFHNGDTKIGAANGAGVGVACADNTAFVATNATKFVVYDNVKETIAVYEGVSEMVNIADGSSITVNALYKTAGKAAVVVIETNASSANKTSAKDLVYLLDTEYVATKVGDDYIYTYAAIVNGVEGTFSLKNDFIGAGHVTNAAADQKLYYVSEYDGAYVSNLAAVSNGTPANYAYASQVSGYAAEYSEGVLTINSVAYVLDDDCALYSINKLGEMSTITVDDLTSDVTSLEYTIVTYAAAGDAPVATAIYVQKTV